MVAGIRSSGILLACSTARSFSGCTPVIEALDSRPSEKMTLMWSAPDTTCRLVRMTPLSMITTPVPTPFSTSSSSLSELSLLPGAGPSGLGLAILSDLAGWSSLIRLFFT